MSEQLHLFAPDDFRPPMCWELTSDGREVCHACRQERTPELHDPCIAHTPGVLFACCGHGLTEPYVVLTAAGGPQSDLEYFRLSDPHAADGNAHLRGDRLEGPEAAAKLRELRRHLDEGHSELARYQAHANS